MRAARAALILSIGEQGDDAVFSEDDDSEPLLEVKYAWCVRRVQSDDPVFAGPFDREATLAEPITALVASRLWKCQPCVRTPPS
jgi:hypothetical protein